MPVEPYLFFDGRTEEALDFYRRELGAEVEAMMRFSESPDPVPEGMIPAGSGHKIMHSAFRLGGSRVMASDGNCAMKPQFSGVSLSFSVPSAAEAERVFARLADGGQVQQPLMQTFFSERFGMVADRFGVNWIVIADQQPVQRPT